jgi:phosphoserine phosphatase
VTDVLASWNEGQAKKAIIDFVASATQPGPGFVEPTDRIATFDYDGTLWCEKPSYVQADFFLRRMREMIEAKPELAKEQPFKAIAENDEDFLGHLLEHAAELAKGVTEAYADITTEAFEQAVETFFASATHPTLGVPYTSVGYQPMRELVELLRAHDFTVYVCSGGGRDFVRVVSEQMFGITREHVIGSGTTLEYREGDVYRTKGVEEPFDEHGGKPVHIWTRTGRKPLFAAGNTNGDQAMLEVARFSLMVNHDDGEREFAYTELAENAMAEAVKRGWMVVSMKDDWKSVFAERGL